jgi:transmembrane sensor
MTRQTAESIEQDAADWVARLDRHGQTAELGAALDVWLAGDPRREGALIQARAMWNLIGDQVAQGPEAVREQAAPEAAVPAIVALPEALPGPRSRTRRYALLGGGAAIAASVLTGVILASQSKVYETTRGEIRRVPLADGSVVALNTETRLAVMMEPKARIVRLDRGEAFFQVAKDKNRPFTAQAGKIRVRAVGTAFSVRVRDNGADVLVSEGVVEAWTSGAEGNLIRVSAGRQAFVANDAGVVRKAPGAAEIDRTLAWRTGLIDLAGEPLAHAVAEFNRYNARKIVVSDPTLGEEPLYGVFRIDDPQGFAEAIRQGFGAPVDYSGDQEILIGVPTRKI